jgi:hypothetical protein
MKAHTRLSNAINKDDDQWEWLQVSPDMTYACGGMARAALWLLSQVHFNHPIDLTNNFRRYISVCHLNMILLNYFLGGAVVDEALFRGI